MGRHHKGYLAAVRCSPDPLLPLLFQKSECLFVLPLRSPLPAILVCKSQNFNNTIFSTGRLKNFPQNNTRFNIARKRLRGPAGPRRLGTATHMSASLFRRLSAFFGSTPGQDPKAAKFAVLTPGPGMFVNVRNAPKVVIAPPSETPLFRRVSPCVRFFEQRRVCTRFHPSMRTWAVCERS